MKTILCLLLSLNLVSCATDGKIDQERASRLVDIALDYAVRTGKVTPSDAALVREVGTIVLEKTPEADPTVVGAPVTVTK